MARPTKWDRDIANAVWRQLEASATDKRSEDPRIYIAAVRKDAEALIRCLMSYDYIEPPGNPTPHPAPVEV